MAYQYLKCEIKNKIAIVTITREEALNALNIGVEAEIKDVMKKIEAEGEAGIILLTGSGRAFVAGADIAMMCKQEGWEGRENSRGSAEMGFLIENLKIPVIAVINGFAFGGGCELAMSCDFRIASNKAKFGQPEVNLGIIPGAGGTQRLPRLVGKGMASYLCMTGEAINAEEALRIGLVERVVEHDKLMDEAIRIAELILSKGQVAVRVAKCAINVAVNSDIRTGMAYEAEAFGTTFQTKDRVEGMTAFLEKRDAKFTGK